MNTIFRIFFLLLCLSVVAKAVKQWRKAKTANLIVPTVKCFFVINGEFTFDEAKQSCQVRDASLATLNTLSEDQFIRSEIDWDKVPGFARNASWIGQLWLGLERISPEPWKWIDGTPLRFSSWLAGEGNTTNNDHECIITRKFGWINSYHCDATVLSNSGRQIQEGVGALCAKTVYEVSQKATEMGANFCGSTMLPSISNKFSMSSVTKKTFFVVKGQFSWAEAKWMCQTRGGQLAILRTKEEDDFVKKHIDIETAGGNLWIGLYRLSANYFEWYDGSPARYTGWFSPEISGQMPEVQTPNCTVIKTWKVRRVYLTIKVLFIYLFYKQANEIATKELIAWAPLDCSADVDSMVNWAEGPPFPIGALCESATPM